VADRSVGRDLVDRALEDIVVMGAGGVGRIGRRQVEQRA
jgi:hypothetical protein